jgi:hypothetical protein
MCRRVVSWRQIRADTAARPSHFACLRGAPDRLDGDLPGAVPNGMLGRGGSGLRLRHWWDYPDRRQARESLGGRPLY